MKVNLHTHQKSKGQNIVDIVNQYPRDFDVSTSLFSIGIHPWYIEEEHIKGDLQIIEDCLQLDNALAVGECGLDKRIDVPWELQCAVFEQQLQIAEQFQKPVLIHCVGAYAEVLQLTKKHKLTVPILFHGFSKNTQVAQMLLKEGCYLSFGKYLLSNPKLSEVLRQMPLEYVFLETDSSSFTIDEVYEKAGEVLGLSGSELELRIIQNAQCVFGFSQSFQNKIK